MKGGSEQENEIGKWRKKRQKDNELETKYAGSSYIT
jgi:hypothetical protein